MERLFNRYAQAGVNFVSIDYDLGRKHITDNVSSSMSYYQRNPKRIDNGNVFVRLLQSMGNLVGASVIVRRRINNNASKISAGLGINTDNNPGDYFRNAFYAEHTYIRAMEFDLNADSNNYKNIKAVKVLVYDGLDLDYRLPTELDILPGISVIGVDLGLLAKQYRLWLNINNNLPLKEQEPITHFVSRWVLPNMIKDQVELAVRNRIIHYSNTSTPLLNNQTKSSFITIDAIPYIDEGINNLIESYSLRKMGYYELFKAIPSIYGDSYMDAIPSDVVGMMPYSYWLGLMVFSPWLEIILGDRLNVDTTKDRLRGNLKSINRYVRGSRTLRFMDSSAKGYAIPLYAKLIRDITG